MLTIACKRGWLTNCQISITIKREVLLAVLKNYANLSFICQLGRNKKKKIWESWQFGNDRKFINNLSTFKCNFHAASLCHNTQRSSISPLQLWLITKSLIRSKGTENSSAHLSAALSTVPYKPMDTRRVPALCVRTSVKQKYTQLFNQAKESLPQRRD